MFRFRNGTHVLLWMCVHVSAMVRRIHNKKIILEKEILFDLHTHVIPIACSFS